MEAVRVDRLEVKPEWPSTAEAQPKPAPQSAPNARAPQARPLGEQAVQSSAAVNSVIASGVALSPERMLEGIAELRKEGRHEEADKALEEFRKLYPDYRISEEMLRKVERSR